MEKPAIPGMAKWVAEPAAISSSKGFAEIPIRTAGAMLSSSSKTAT